MDNLHGQRVNSNSQQYGKRLVGSSALVFASK